MLCCLFWSFTSVIVQRISLLNVRRDLMSKVLKKPRVFPRERRRGLPVPPHPSPHLPPPLPQKTTSKEKEQIRLLCSTNDNKDWHIEVDGADFSHFNFDVKPSGAEAIIGVYRNRAPLHFRRFNCDGDVKRLRVEIWAGGGGRICGSGSARWRLADRSHFNVSRRRCPLAPRLL